MNCLVREVLKEVIFGLLIMEPHRIKKREGKRRRGRTMTSYRVLGGNIIFRCPEKETKPKERERERREIKRHSRRIRH